MDRDTAIIDEVIDCIKMHIRQRGSDATIESIAATLHVSSRSLQRRLMEAGTSYRAIRNEVMKRMLEELIAHRGISGAQDALNYSDYSAIRRACLRFLGRTPREIMESMITLREGTVIDSDSIKAHVEQEKKLSDLSG